MMQCSTCLNGTGDSPLVSSYVNHKGQISWQCEDCMNGSNCFTCEFCGDGLATEQVDYISGYREWWCIGCTEDERRLFKSSTKEHEWIFKDD